MVRSIFYRVCGKTDGGLMAEKRVSFPEEAPLTIRSLKEAALSLLQRKGYSTGMYSLEVPASIQLQTKTTEHGWEDLDDDEELADQGIPAEIKVNLQMWLVRKLSNLQAFGIHEFRDSLG